MKSLLVLFTLVALSFTATAQPNLTRYTGKFAGEKCTMQINSYIKKGENGMEDGITYKGWIKTSKKKLNFTGYFEGNVIFLSEIINGKKVPTMTFDLSEAEEGYDLVGKRIVKEKKQRILLQEVKK